MNSWILHINKYLTNNKTLDLLLSHQTEGFSITMGSNKLNNNKNNCNSWEEHITKNNTKSWLINYPREWRCFKNNGIKEVNKKKNTFNSWEKHIATNITKSWLINQSTNWRCHKKHLMKFLKYKEKNWSSW